MKLFILGLDGLEYNLVETWNLEHLKQDYYGKLSFAVSSNTQYPNTIDIWASFLCGEDIVGLQWLGKGLKWRVLYVLKLLRKKIPFGMGIGRLFRSERQFPALNRITFLDISPQMSEINVPFYSYDHRVISKLACFGRKTLTIDGSIRELFKIYRQRQTQIIREIKEKQLHSIGIFTYMHFPDSISHFLFLQPKRLKELYHDLDYFVLKLKDVLPEDVIFIIVSDHGFDMKKGLHSYHAFYSSNCILDEEPKKITDFFGIIRRIYLMFW